jgi:hypothetical protein
MDALDPQTQVDNNPSSPIEGNDGGAQLAPQPVQPAEPAPKGPLEQLKEKAAAGVAPPAVKAAAAPGEPAVPAFKPTLKFKAAGKELDVPEMFHGLMKDEKSQAYLHSLLSKAHGIEMIQGKLKDTRESRDQAVNAYQQVMQPIQLGQEAYKRGDMDTVFNVLRIDPNKVLQWAYRKVELSQMDPAQRQVHEAREAAERRNWELERAQQTQEQAGIQSQSEQINQMLDVVLERQDFTAIAQRYDERMSKAGKTQTFRDLCLTMGENAWNQGKKISVMEAAKQAAELLGEDLGAKSAPHAPAAPALAQTAQPAASAPEVKKTLPNVGGSKSAAPAKSKIKSIDDIRKVHQQLANS